MARRPPTRVDQYDTWERRLSFFRGSVVVDGVAPLLGIGIITYQTMIQSGLIPPYIVAAGLIGLPGVARIAGLLGSGR